MTKRRLLRILKRTGLFFLLAVVLLNVYILFTGKYYIYNAVYHNFADIDDYKIFAKRVMHKADKPEPWPLSVHYNKYNLPDALTSRLKEYNSVAFLLIKKDSLYLEEYWDGYSATSASNSFSMAKSFISALIGIAIREGKIKSVDQAVHEFLPEFREGDKRNIRIKHLLTMSSGLEWDEAYANPFSVTTEAYYGNDLRAIFKNQPVVRKPGEEFEYKSGDTQLLGFILEKATGKSIAAYAEEKLWKPLGTERDAWWSLDREDGHEKAYCCINSNARDFARLGYLYMHHGNWKGKQIIDSSYVTQSVTPAALKYQNAPVDFYGYQWWIIPEYKGKRIFYARGILGQLIVVIPEEDIIAVRLGKNRGEKVQNHFGLVFEIVDGIEKLVPRRQ